MTPAEHIAQAEAFLQQAPSPDANDYSMIDMAISVNALAHACIAIAVELGVPHAAAASAVTGGG